MSHGYTMTEDFYLIVSKGQRGRSLSVRVAARTPSLKVGEVAMSVTLRLPSTLFEKPQLKASITVPDDKVSAPVISAEVAANIGEIVKQQTGLDLTIMVQVP